MLKIKCSYYPGVWGRDLIVIRRFRSFIGIGPLLIDSVLKDTKDKSALFLIAGLNETSYALFKRFNFTDLGCIPLYVRIIKLDKGDKVASVAKVVKE